jgi:hypothetical protein
VENLRERNLLEDPGLDEKTILRWIFRELVRGAWTGLIWLRIGTRGGTPVQAVMNLKFP